MQGHGSFELDSSLVVVRGWWIDSCKYSNNNNNNDEMVIEINDDYFKEINNNNIETFDDLISSPIILPIYDHFIVNNNECREHLEKYGIHGIITSYKPDILHEKLILTIDTQDSSPLMYFNEADFKINKMKQLQMIENNRPEEQEQEQELERRRRRLGVGGSIDYTIDIPMPSISATKSVYIKGRHIGDCTPSIDTYFQLTIGFELKLKSNLLGLKKIASTLGIESGIDLEIMCDFFPDEEAYDGVVDVTIYEKTVEQGPYRYSIGPVMITVTPFVDIGVSLQRPAMNVVLRGSGDVTAGFIANGGWSKNDGAFGGIDTTFKSESFSFDDPYYPGKDGRLEGSFSIDIEPGVAFGLYNKKLLTFSAPIQLPLINAALSIDIDTSTNCDSGSVALFFDIEFLFTVTVKFKIKKIKLYGITIFKSYTWTPKEALYELTIWSDRFSIDSDVNNGCKSKDEIHSGTLFSDGYNSYTYDNYPYILLESADADIDWESANAYCSLEYSSTLATIKTQTKVDQVDELLDSVLPSEITVENLPWMGLYNFGEARLINDDSDFNWVSDGTDFEGSWFAGAGSPGTYCSVFQSQYQTSGAGFTSADCSTSRKYWICDLNHIYEKYERFIGVYTYDSYFTWSEANDYCNETFGTELATILNQEQNDQAWETIANIRNDHTHTTDNIFWAWIGMNNIESSTIFDWQDGRDSDTTGYTNWATIYSQPNNLGTQKCGVNMYQNHVSKVEYTEKQWKNHECEETLNAFTCNRPNFYNYYEYYHFIGVEALEYALTFDEANTVCDEEFGTQLASIHSSWEQDLIIELVDHMGWDEINGRYATIGFTNPSGDTINWVDGTETTYTNWNSNENIRFETERCGVILPSANSEWHDSQCTKKRRYFVCNRPISTFEYKDYVGINTYDNDYTYTFDEANNYCHTHYNTYLASVSSAADIDDINYIFNETDGVYTWIGLNDMNNEGTFEWIDSNTQVTNTNWYSGAPTSNSNNNDGDSLDCVILAPYEFGMWIDTYCDSGFTSFICNRETEEIVSKDFIGISLHNNFNGQVNYDEANSYCMQHYGTTLASILSDDQWEQAQSIFDSFGALTDIYIGLNDKLSLNNYEWQDGHSVSSYTQWAASKPSTYSDGEHCVYLMGVDNDEAGLWNEISCDSYLKAFICNKNISTYQDSTYIIVNTHNNYVDDFTWSKANDYCMENFDTTLGTGMDNDDDFNITVDMFTNILLGEIEVNNDFAWIGLSDSSSEGTYEWIDQSGTVSANSKYWSSSWPDGYQTSTDCIELGMLTENEIGWNDRSCETTRTSNLFFCNNKYEIYRYGNYIGVNGYTSLLNYGTITFDEAENYCLTNFGSHLASVHDDEDWDDMLTIVDKFSESSTNLIGTWIGFYDELGDNNFVWIDESENEDDYTQWYTNEPNELTTNDCTIISNGELKWVDYSCTSGVESFICNTEPADEVCSTTLLPWYRYWRSSVTNHFYTTDRDVIGTTVVGETGSYNYEFEGIEGYLFETQIDGTVPYYRFYYSSGGSHDHAYSTSSSIGLSGYTYEGVRGYIASDSNSIDSVCCPSILTPLYEYYYEDEHDHFYTITYQGLSISNEKYQYQGISGYVCQTSQ